VHREHYSLPKTAGDAAGGATARMWWRGTAIRTASRMVASGTLQIKTGAGYPAPATYANNNYFFLAAFFLATFFFAFFFAAIIVSLKLT
jgi:hypothetical protein